MPCTVLVSEFGCVLCCVRSVRACPQGFQFVTCGSVLKLVNPASGVRLHSHEVKYGSGSGQQVSSVLLCVLYVVCLIRVYMYLCVCV